MKPRKKKTAKKKTPLDAALDDLIQAAMAAELAFSSEAKSAEQKLSQARARVLALVERDGKGPPGASLATRIDALARVGRQPWPFCLVDHNRTGGRGAAIPSPRLMVSLKRGALHLYVNKEGELEMYMPTGEGELLVKPHVSNRISVRLATRDWGKRR